MNPNAPVVGGLAIDARIDHFLSDTGLRAGDPVVVPLAGVASDRK
jgi:hypothetical protein